MNKTSHLWKKTLKYSASAALALHIFSPAAVAGAADSKSAEVRAADATTAKDTPVGGTGDTPAPATPIIHHPEMSALIAPNDPAYFGVPTPDDSAANEVESAPTNSATTTVDGKVVNSTNMGAVARPNPTKASTSDEDTASNAAANTATKPVAGLSSSSTPVVSAAEYAAAQMAAPVDTSVVATPAPATEAPASGAPTAEAAGTAANSAVAATTVADAAVTGPVAAQDPVAGAGDATATHADATAPTAPQVTNVAQVADTTGENATGTIAPWLLIAIAAIVGLGMLAVAALRRVITR